MSRGEVTLNHAPFDDLVAEALAADVSGWGFGFLDGRATEERPRWRYSTILADRLAHAESALDIDTGGGELINESPVLPPRMVVTEPWWPNVDRAREILEPRGVAVEQTEPGAPLPFPDGSFDLLTSRHPVFPDWAEIARVLTPGGRYVAQHVGPASAFELIEYFLGPQPEARKLRDPKTECAAARQAGLDVIDLRTARCRMEFFDVGAIIWILRKCVWWVPGFKEDIEKYQDKLMTLDRQMRGGASFAAWSTRHLVEARKV